jgi:hypothetical protein
MKQLPKVAVKTYFTPFEGGLDTETPRIAVKPGRVRASQNVYQGPNGGYMVMGGYERYSGKAAPSAATYSTLPVTLAAAVVVGDVVTDNTAAAYGTVIAITTTHLVLTLVTGVFAVGNIKIGAAVVGTCSAAQTAGNATTKRLDAQYTNLAADVYRSAIAAVPGSGALRGIWYYKGTWYAVRNAVDGLSEAMYKSSALGWAAVALGMELNFTSGGTYEIKAGDTITGSVGGATAVITKVAVQDGTWAGGDCVGKLIFATKTGNFQAENLNVGANMNVATIAGNAAAITFANPNGKFEFRNANFTGSQDTSKIYGCDGANRGFEFDGTTFVPIETGMSTYPTHVYEHKYQLFFSFLGSAQHSAPGLPYVWSPIYGEDEIGMGDRITGFVSQPGSETASTLSIFNRNSIGMLYGSTTADWNLALYKKEAGAIEWTAQFIGNTFMLDDRGITKLTTSQGYGNFSDATVSVNFQSWLETKKQQVSCSFVSSDKNLYGIFFNDKTGIFCTVKGGEIVAAMPVIFPAKVTCICATEDTSGNEIIMFGDENGFVHQMFSGTSFDGAEIEWSLDLVYDHINSPTVAKRFRKGIFEIQGDGYAEFNFSYSLGYGSADIAQPASQMGEMILSSENWDAFTWDAFTWDGVNLSPMSFDMSGTATNISLRLQGRSDYNSPLKFSGALLQYSPTKETR